MRERHYEEPNGNKTVLPAIIKPKLASARNCIVPPCQLCLLARARKCTPNVLRMRLLNNHEVAITRDQYNVGDFVSTDQFICKTPGRSPTRYGCEWQDCRFQGSTIFNDAASGLIWVENQVSIGANKMVMGKAVSSSGFMTNVSVKLSTIMVIMVSSPRRSFGITVRRNKKVSHSLALVPNTRMHVLNVQFRPSCIWRRLLWFTPPYIGQKEAQMTSLSGPLL